MTQTSDPELPKHKFVKGDEFWTVQVQGFDGPLAVPIVRRGVVTGGGDVMINYQITEVNGDSSPESLRGQNGYSSRGYITTSRYQFEGSAHDTRAEAIRQALHKLRGIRFEASQTAQRAAEGFRWLALGGDDPETSTE